MENLCGTGGTRLLHTEQGAERFVRCASDRRQREALGAGAVRGRLWEPGLGRGWRPWRPGRSQQKKALGMGLRAGCGAVGRAGED